MNDETMYYPINSWNDAVLNATANLLNGILDVIPAIIGAIVVFLVGWLLAIWVKAALRHLFDMLQLDSLADKLGMTHFLRASGYHNPPKDALASVAKWFIIVVFFLAALTIIGLPVVGDALNQIILYIPKVIAAVLILVGGLILADFLSNVLRGTLKTMEFQMAGTIANLAKWVLIVFTVLAVIRQLDIVPDLINILFTGIVGALALGIGLMVGLGGKDVMNDIFRTWYDRMKRQ